MDKEAVFEQLSLLAEEYLKSRGLDLVELTHRYEGNRLYLALLADRPEGGISVEECASVNRDLSAILEEKDLFSGSYVLEVSSPGLDRPLVTKKDFLRNLNKKARFFFTEQVEGKFEVEGIIIQVSEGEVEIKIGQEHKKVPLSLIRKAKQIF